jgi:hypothetical protein
MRRALAGAVLAAWLLVGDAGGQSSTGTGASDPVVVFTERPRLFLRPARLRLLQKERERGSARWQQFEAYVSADAPMPESGLAEALYYQVAGNAEAGRKAIAWALGPGRDLRQLALVFDWCQRLLSEAERRELVKRLEQRLAEASGDESVSGVRNRVLAAVALFDEVPQVPNRELQWAVRKWWEAKIAPALPAGQALAGQADDYALWEILHAIRDNTNLDLRDSVPRFFKSFPVEHLMSHYPASYPGEDNDFRIAASRNTGQPDLEQATFSRVAELAMVAFDTNAQESQYVQGWLMHDRFVLRSPLGAPYEFLWANPYQPGLSFTLLPLVYHNPDSGRVFVRSDWEESADWFGYFDGVAQLFRDGRVQSLPLSSTQGVVLASAVIYFGATRFRVKLDEGQDAVVLVGLEPHRTYQVEIDDEEVFEQTADRGGVMLLDLPHGKEVGVRMRPLSP